MLKNKLIVLKTFMSCLSGTLLSKTEKVYLLKYATVSVTVFYTINIWESELIALPVGSNELYFQEEQDFSVCVCTWSFYYIACSFVLFFFSEKISDNRHCNFFLTLSRLFLYICRLGWFAVAGNDCCPISTARPSLNESAFE